MSKEKEQPERTQDVCREDLQANTPARESGDGGWASMQAILANEGCSFWQLQYIWETRKFCLLRRREVGRIRQGRRKVGRFKLSVIGNERQK